jgi:predicted dehydrogenase
MVEHFADVVRGEDQAAYSPQESIANMRALEALARAARNGEPVTVEND